MGISSRALTVGLLLLLFVPLRSNAQGQFEMPPDAPPVGVTTSCHRDAMNRAMRPFIAQARATFPAARQLFLAGLPPGHNFFVTTRLSDAAGREEQVFVAVDTIANDQITGRISNRVLVVSGYRMGQRYTFSESKLVDWLIIRPDGSDEGNVVGKFMETYRPPKVCPSRRPADDYRVCLRSHCYLVAASTHSRQQIFDARRSPGR
jgi:hypothetical protein